MSTFVIELCLWYIGYVIVFKGHFTTMINRKYRLWYNVSVPYPKSGLAENTGNGELEAAPRGEYFYEIYEKADNGTTLLMFNIV